MTYKWNKKGVVLPYVLIIGTFLMLLASGLFILSGSNLKLFRDGYQDRQAMLNAKSAVEYARAYLYTCENAPQNFYVTATLDTNNVATDFNVAEYSGSSADLGKPNKDGLARLASCVLTEETGGNVNKMYDVAVNGRCISKDNSAKKPRYEYLNYKSKLKLSGQSQQEPDNVQPNQIMIIDPTVSAANSYQATEDRVIELDTQISGYTAAVSDSNAQVIANMDTTQQDIANASPRQPEHPEKAKAVNGNLPGWIAKANKLGAANPNTIIQINGTNVQTSVGAKSSADGQADTLTAPYTLFEDGLVVDTNFVVNAEYINIGTGLTVNDSFTATFNAFEFYTHVVRCGDNTTLTIAPRIGDTNARSQANFGDMRDTPSIFGKNSTLNITTGWFYTKNEVVCTDGTAKLNATNLSTASNMVNFMSAIKGFSSVDINRPHGKAGFNNVTTENGQKWNISAKIVELYQTTVNSGSVLNVGAYYKDTPSSYVLVYGNLNVTNGTFTSQADLLQITGTANLINPVVNITPVANSTSASFVNIGANLMQSGGNSKLSATGVSVAAAVQASGGATLSFEQAGDASAAGSVTIGGAFLAAGASTVNMTTTNTIIAGSADISQSSNLNFNKDSRLRTTRVEIGGALAVKLGSKANFNTVGVLIKGSVDVNDTDEKGVISTLSVTPGDKDEINYIYFYDSVTTQQKASIDITSTYTSVRSNAFIHTESTMAIKPHTPNNLISVALFVGVDNNNNVVTDKTVQNDSNLSISSDYAHFNGLYTTKNSKSVSKLTILPVADVTDPTKFLRPNNVYMNKIDVANDTANLNPTINITADYADFTGNPYTEMPAPPTADTVFSPAVDNSVALGKNTVFTVSPRVLTNEFESSVYLGNVKADTAKITLKTHSAVLKGTFDAASTELTASQVTDYNTVFVCEGNFNYNKGKINLFAGEEHAIAVKFSGLVTLENVTDFNINAQNILMENTLTFKGATKTNLGFNVTTPTPVVYNGLMELSTVVSENPQTLDATALDFLILRGNIDKNFAIKHLPTGAHTLSLYCKPLDQSVKTITTNGNIIRKVGYYQISSGESGNNILDDKSWFAKKIAGFPKVPPIPYEYKLPKDENGKPIFPVAPPIGGGVVDVVFPQTPVNSAGFAQIAGGGINQGVITTAGDSPLWVGGAMSASNLTFGTTTTDPVTKKVTLNTDTIVFDGKFTGTGNTINAKKVYFLGGAANKSLGCTINAEYVYFGTPADKTPPDIGNVNITLFNDEDLDSQIYGVVFDTPFLPDKQVNITANSKAPNTYVDFRKNYTANVGTADVTLDGLHYVCFKDKISPLTTATLNILNTTYVEFKDEVDTNSTIKINGANIISYDDLLLRGNVNITMNAANIVFNESIIRNSGDVSGQSTSLYVYMAGLSDDQSTTVHFTKELTRCFPNSALPPFKYNKGGITYNKGLAHNWLTDNAQSDPTINPPILPDFPGTGKAVIEQEVYLK